MVNPILQDFRVDLDRMKRILALAQAAGALRSCALDPESILLEDLRNAVIGLHAAVQLSHVEMPILNGVLLLYLAGRFENYVREVFEDLADTVAENCGKFTHLPKQMQENLIKLTAEVIANPRKYGHAENGVKTFVSRLADNLSGEPLTGVNSKCLSITSENMWPDTLSEIFGRIGAAKVWERVGQQARVQRFFQVDQPEKATSEARKLLIRFMELRNQIAHPSGALEWPRIDETLRYLDYCDVVGQSLSDICTVWATTLGSKSEHVARENVEIPTQAVPRAVVQG
jgi:RiboL-PSP-HEPN